MTVYDREQMHSFMPLAATVNIRFCWGNDKNHWKQSNGQAAIHIKDYARKF